MQAKCHSVLTLFTTIFEMQHLVLFSFFVRVISWPRHRMTVRLTGKPNKPRTHGLRIFFGDNGHNGIFFDRWSFLRFERDGHSRVPNRFHPI